MVVGRWMWGGGCRCGEGGCREVGVSVGWVCGRWVRVWEVGVGAGCGHGESNPVHIQKCTYLEPDSIISSLFVQSVIFCHSCVVC